MILMVALALVGPTAVPLLASVTAVPAAHAGPDTTDILLELYERHTGHAATGDVLREAAEIADVFDSLQDEIVCCPLDDHYHVGEIWTVCNEWFHRCQASGIGPLFPPEDSPYCTHVPAAPGLDVWVDRNVIVFVGIGDHYTFTEDQLGLGAGHGHGAGKLFGPTCAMWVGGLFFTKTTGAAAF